MKLNKREVELLERVIMYTAYGKGYHSKSKVAKRLIEREMLVEHIKRENTSIGEVMIPVLYITQYGNYAYCQYCVDNDIK